MTSHNTNPMYSQHSRAQTDGPLPRPVRQASSSGGAGTPAGALDNHDAEDLYASYGAGDNNNNNYPASAYGGITSSAYSHQQHETPTTAIETPPPQSQLPAVPQYNQQKQQQQSQQYHQPSMYPSSSSNPTRETNYGSSTSNNAYMLPRDDSVDIVSDSMLGHGDTASTHSRSHLNPTYQQQQPSSTAINDRAVHPLVARFQSDQIRPSAKYLNGQPPQPVAQDYAEKVNNNDGTGNPLNEKHTSRELPAGYKTPPSFSRASSAWGSYTGNSKGRHQNKNKGNTTPSTPGSPYGTLGGIASKSDPALQFAEGDYANNKFARLWLAILSRNMFVRWLCFIIPVLLLLWIPGICGVTINPTPEVWEVPLLNWSIWLTIVWVGWWVAMLVAMIGPHVLRATFGAVAPELRHLIDYLFALKKSLAAFLWSFANWVAFQPLILVQGPADRGTGSGLTLSQITKFLFAIFICSIILVVEKFLIQVIAYNFHRTSYADRISENKFAVRSLVTLYLNSRDIGRSDTLDGDPMLKGKTDPAKFIRKGLRNARRVVTGASTALGTVASEIVGERVMQSNSPQSMVTAALSSSSKSRHLARRIFFSFTPSNRSVMIKSDIAPYFPNRDQLDMVYAIFDRDENGDVSLEEIEMACLEIHRERQSLASSMRDLDSAVARLDQIFMSLWYILSILIIIGIVSISFSAFVTSGATFVLGLSWLIGTTAQEVLASVIFLLAKHPYDVGDLIAIDGYEGTFVVKEIALLSTVFKKTDGNITQMPHTIVNTKSIQNYRRSGPTSETVSWDVDFSTTFEAIEELRQKMLEFVETERRDFRTECDITVDTFADQTKMTLKSSIPYKTNWSNSALKSQRRNKWICALKLAMGDVQIYGPAGAGNPSPAPADPQEIKILNPDAIPPTYRSTTGLNDASPAPGATTAAAERSSPRPSSQRGSQNTLSLSEQVNRISLTNRDNVIEDVHTDIFEGQGDANRVETLNTAEEEHAASVQIEGRSTALDLHPSSEGAALNRFRQQDLELGKLRSTKPE